MGYGIKLKVWGSFALFTRPEMKVERVSYDVLTPSATRGILEAIYWKPQMRWVVDRIHVLAPIRFTQVRRNEISSKIQFDGPTGVARAMASGQGNLAIAVQEHRQQRAALLLRDVCYGITAHVRLTDPTDRQGSRLKAPEAKHLETFKRRAARGQYFHHPYLGCREFPADFELVDSFPSCPPALKGERELGLMLHDILFVRDASGKIRDSYRGMRLTAEPRFFPATLHDGVLNVPPIEPERA